MAEVRYDFHVKAKCYYACADKKQLLTMSVNVQQYATIYSLLYFSKLLYMFRVVLSPIIRSTCNCNYSIWNWSNRFCYLPL